MGLNEGFRGEMPQEPRLTHRQSGMRRLAYAGIVIVILLLIAPPLVMAPAAIAASYPIVALVAALLAIACGLAYYYGIPPRAGPR